MKFKYILLALLLPLIRILAGGPENSSETQYNRWKAVHAKNSGFTESQWAKAITAAAKLTNQDDEGKFSLTSNIWGITNISRVLKDETDVIDKDFANNWWQRRINMSVSLTPENKTSVNLKNAGLKLSFQIGANDYIEADGEDYKRLATPIMDRQEAIKAAMESLSRGDKAAHDNVMKYIDGKQDTNLIPKNIREQVRNDFKISGSMNDAVFSDKAIEDTIKSYLATKAITTLSLGYLKNLEGGRTDCFSSGIQYICKPSAIFDASVSGAFKMADDTTEKSQNLDRMTLTFVTGLNLKCSSLFELKGDLEYSNIMKHVYAKEDQNKLTCSITARLVLTNKTQIPVKISYDPKNGKILGFLTIQLMAG